MVSTAAAPRPGRALRKLTLTETKMLGRTPAVLFWAVGFPVAGIIVLGLIPAANKPVAGLGGISVLQTYLPIIIIFTLVMTAVNFLPATLVSYRERGVLRRMFTTPVKPRTLLTAQILLNLAVQVATVALIVVLAVAAFGATIGQPPGFIIANALTAAAASAVGLLVAAVCATSATSPRSARAARRSSPRRPGTGPPGGTSPCWRVTSWSAAPWPSGCSAGSDFGGAGASGRPAVTRWAAAAPEGQKMVDIRALRFAPPEIWLDWLLRVIPFLLLAVAFLPYVLAQAPTAGDIGRTLAVTALAAVWLGWFVVLRPLRVRDPQGLMPVYFVGFLAARRAGTTP